MRFINYIAELSLAKNAKWWKVEDMNDRKTYEIHLPGDVLYVFDAYKAYVGNWLFNQFPDVIFENMIWTIGFNDAKGRIEQVTKGASEALTLFATIEEIFKDFLRTTKPNVFIFDAEIHEKSRVKLYDLLAKRIAKTRQYQAFESTADGLKSYIFAKPEYVKSDKIEGPFM